MARSSTYIFAYSRKALVGFGSLLFLTFFFAAQSTNAQERVIRASSNATAAGVESQIQIQILLYSQGDEASASFSLNFNPSVLTDPVVTRGADVPAGSNLEITNNLVQGQVGILVGSSTTFAAGPRSIVNVRFTVPANAQPGTYPIGFGSVPTPQSVLNSTGTPLATTYQQGGVTIGTADGVGVSGRIVTPDGRGIVNATVIAIDTDGNRRFATTSSFGYYQIPYVRLGQTYTFSVQSKRYRFTPRVIQIVGPLSNFDFVGQQ